MKQINLIKMMFLAVVMMVGSISVWGATATYTVTSTKKSYICRNELTDDRFPNFYRRLRLCSS